MVAPATGVLSSLTPVPAKCGNICGLFLLDHLAIRVFRSLLGRSTFSIETDAPRSDQGGVDFGPKGLQHFTAMNEWKE